MMKKIVDSRIVRGGVGCGAGGEEWEWEVRIEAREEDDEADRRRKKEEHVYIGAKEEIYISLTGSLSHQLQPQY